MSRCKSCGAEIVWLKTFSGKKTPVNAERLWFFEGGDELFVTEEGAVIHGTRTTDNIAQAGSRVGYVSHFATCPNVDKHRKG